MSSALAMIFFFFRKFRRKSKNHLKKKKELKKNWKILEQSDYFRRKNAIREVMKKSRLNPAAWHEQFRFLLLYKEVYIVRFPQTY